MAAVNVKQTWIEVIWSDMLVPELDASRSRELRGQNVTYSQPVISTSVCTYDTRLNRIFMDTFAHSTGVSMSLQFSSVTDTSKDTISSSWTPAHPLSSVLYFSSGGGREKALGRGQKWGKEERVAEERSESEDESSIAECPQYHVTVHMVQVNFVTQLGQIDSVGWIAIHKKKKTVFKNLCLGFQLSIAMVTYMLLHNGVTETDSPVGTWRGITRTVSLAAYKTNQTLVQLEWNASSLDWLLLTHSNNPHTCGTRVHGDIMLLWRDKKCHHQSLTQIFFVIHSHCTSVIWHWQSSTHIVALLYDVDYVGRVTLPRLYLCPGAT